MNITKMAFLWMITSYPASVTQMTCFAISFRQDKILTLKRKKIKIKRKKESPHKPPNERKINGSCMGSNQIRLMHRY